MMKRLMVAVQFLVLCSWRTAPAIGVVTARASNPEETLATKKKISFAEVAPEVNCQFRRYLKFYGDPDTQDGSLKVQPVMTDGGSRG